MLLPLLFILSIVLVPYDGKHFTKSLTNLLVLLDFFFKDLDLAHCLKVNGEDRANTDLTFYLERTAHLVHNRFADRKAKSSSLRVGLFMFFKVSEVLKEAVYFLLGDAGTEVLNT
jgi:hypothetical protein